MLLLALGLAMGLSAAERLKVQEENTVDLESFNRSHGAELVKWQHPRYAPVPGADWVERAVRVAFVVDEAGNVTNAEALGGAEEYKAAAVEAVSGWKFKPAMQDGQPEAQELEVRIPFSPKGTPKRKQTDDLISPYRPELPPVSDPGDPPSSEAPYPPALKARRLRGFVELELGVNKEGEVEGLKVLGATHPEFLGSAVTTAAAWRMRPAHRGRRGVESRKQAVLEFFVVDEEGKPLTADWLECAGIKLRLPEAPRADEYFDTPPQAFAMVDPVYPRELLLSRITGRARVNFSVDEEGRVMKVTIEEATAPEFGAAAAAAISAWRFKPMRRGGVVCPADFTFTWQFDLPGDESPERRLLGALGTPQQAVTTKELDRPLFLLFARSPVYPLDRLKEAAAGEASIEVYVDRDGRVRLPRIRSTSHPDFGWSAATAVTQWLFETPRKNGQPVDVRVLIPVKFKAPVPEQ